MWRNLGFDEQEEHPLFRIRTQRFWVMSKPSAICNK
nr:MAG TPA: hypothetical protein [Caudoviricetes sp.]